MKFVLMKNGRPTCTRMSMQGGRSLLGSSGASRSCILYRYGVVGSARPARIGYCSRHDSTTDDQQWQVSAQPSKADDMQLGELWGIPVMVLPVCLWTWAGAW
jgi:hypothetical protein